MAGNLGIGLQVSMLKLFLILSAFLVGYLLGRHRIYQLQNLSEAFVSRSLSEAFHSPTYHLLNNVTLRVKDGTTQVDHILVSRYGIFVIESKDYTGWIFADAKSPKWTQVIFKKKNQFQNPLHQNFKHTKAVQALLDFLPSHAIQSAVVFTGDAEFKKSKPDGIFNIKELISHIETFKTEIISQNRLEFCVGRLECQRLALTLETDVAHKTNLQRKFGTYN